ncbi:hypothetical protein AVEN_146226-1 [Araneus ventricosus]|uniref:Reverse transcriptase Ty1/copia-type domain-containing protein n=1 Tax=Araneus ventricosus TaxID=182803 RepID=A0A4Y2P0I9_ARAVE|nr:hypothetical protein AVEN_146226-1 [Araneus ventricosus]
MPSLRLVLVLTPQENLQYMTLDWFEVVYMSNPKTMMMDRKSVRTNGLKQTPREWFQKFQQFTKKLTFKKSSSDPCAYIRK